MFLVSDSGKMKNPIIAADNEKIPDTYAGAAKLIWLNNPPNRGPIMKLSPNAMLKSAKFLVRYFEGDTSVIYAWAIDTLPPVNPSMIRDTYNTHSAPPIPKMT